MPSKQSAELLLLGVLPSLEHDLGKALADVGVIAASVAELDRHAELTNGSPAQIVLVCIDSNRELGLRAVKNLVAAHPNRPVIVLSESKDSDLVLQSMRAGARDFALIEPDHADIVRAVTLMARDRMGIGVGTVISVFGSKGGSGATAIATNLAGMARFKRDLKVVLVDLNLQMGDCLLFLDLDTKYTIADAIRNRSRLDQDLLKSLLAVHSSSGVHVLSQSSRIEDSDQVTSEKVSALLQVLKRHYDVVVIDGLGGFDELSLAALDTSDQVLLVLTQDIPAIKNARRCLDIFRRLDYSEKNIHVVLNRYQKGLKLDIPMVVETLGRPVAAHVANDFATIINGINRGVLLFESDPRSRVAEDMEELVTLTLGPAEQRERKGALLSLFSRKKMRDAAS